MGRNSYLLQQLQANSIVFFIFLLSMKNRFGDLSFTCKIFRKGILNAFKVLNCICIVWEIFYWSLQITSWLYIDVFTTWEGDYNTVFLGLYNTGISTAIKPLTVLKKDADLTAITPLTYYFWANDRKVLFWLEALWYRVELHVVQGVVIRSLFFSGTRSGCL